MVESSDSVRLRPLLQITPDEYGSGVTGKHVAVGAAVGRPVVTMAVSMVTLIASRMKFLALPLICFSIHDNALGRQRLRRLASC